MIKKFLFVLFLFLFSVIANYAQPLSKTDSAKVSAYLKKLDPNVQKNNDNDIAYFLNEIASIYWKNNNNDEAIRYFEKALTANIKIKNDENIAVIDNNLGILYNDAEDYDRSLNYFNKTLNYRRNKKVPVGIVSTLLSMSVVQNNLQRYDAAINNLQEALSISKQIQATKQMDSCYAKLGETYNKKGDTTEAKKYIALYKNFYSDIEQKKLKEVSSQFENESLQKEVDLAQAQQVQGEIVNKNITNENIYIQKEKNYIRSISIIIVIACVAIAFIFYAANKKIKQQNLALNTANTTLEIQKEQLAESNDVKDKIFSIIAHDLRNPIASIKSFIGVIDYFDLPEKLKTMFISKDVEVTNTLAVLDNLLLWAKTQMIKSEPVIVSVALNTVIDRTINLLQPIALTKNISIINNTPPNFLVTTDIDLTEIVIRNIIQNAIKFTKPCGQIEVFASEDSLHKIIYIKDNGIGMSSLKAANLFSLKNNTSSRGTANETGTGLGMILSYEFITACKGEIKVTSEEGIGTTLSVYFLK